VLSGKQDFYQGKPEAKPGTHISPFKRAGAGQGGYYEKQI
jgi:hypothetical protein